MVCDDAMVFHGFNFIFLFRTNGKKGHLHENDFLHCYGDFFESVILEVTWSQLCLKFIINSCEAYW